MRSSNWHLLSFDKKKGFLSDLLSLDKDAIDERLWQVILNPYNNGYKVLWYIIDDIGSRIDTDYWEIKSRFSEYLPKDLDEMDLSAQIDAYLHDRMQHKQSCTTNDVYHICMQSFKEILSSYSLPPEAEIKTIFELTQRESHKSRFFWDYYRWEDIKDFIAKEK
jgi:hypothetical protein